MARSHGGGPKPSVSTIEPVTRALRVGLVAASVGAFAVVGSGFVQLAVVNDVQPAKLDGDGDGGPGRAEQVAEWTARFGPGDYLPPQWSACRSAS